MFLLCTLAIAGIAVAGKWKTYRAPFHTAKGMILLDAVVEGKPAFLLLDTGANNTIICAQAPGARYSSTLKPAGDQSRCGLRG